MEEDRMATMQDAVREWAYNFGATCPGQEWLLSDYDTWERNPHFTTVEEAEACREALRKEDPLNEFIEDDR